jgi:NADPH-dependent glutamate synthase beta subunit-like oxidoreductase
VLDTASSKSVSEGEGDDIPTQSYDRQGEARKEEEIPITTKSTSADQSTLLMGTRSGKREEAKEERMETDSHSNEKKELNI